MDIDTGYIKKIQNGCQESFAHLIRKYQKYIFNIIVRISPNVSFHEAEDISQEVLIKVYNNIPDFRFECTFKVWLYKIVINSAIDFIRKNKKAKQNKWVNLRVSDNEYLEKYHPDLLNNPVEARMLIKEMQIKCLIGFFVCLNQRERAVYIFGTILKLPGKMGAQILEMTYANYRKMHSRSKQKIENIMQNSCSLINKKAKCQCKKALSQCLQNNYIKKGKYEYSSDDVKLFRKSLLSANSVFRKFLNKKCHKILRSLPQYESRHTIDSIKKIVTSQDFKAVVNFP